MTLPVLLNGLDKTASVAAAKQIIVTSASIAAHVTGLIADTATRAFEHVRMVMSVFFQQGFHREYPHGGSHLLSLLIFVFPHSL